MKKVQVTAPEDARDLIETILSEYEDDLTVAEVEKDDEPFIRFEVSVDSKDIDELTQAVKEIKQVESGDLTIDILEERATIEKGKRREGGSSILSVQEMYAKAFEFSTFNMTSWVLIALASSIAVFGLVTENVIVVIGSMVIAPMLGPFMSASFGLVIGDRKIIKESVFYGLLSILLAVTFAFLISIPFPMELNDLIRLIAEPRFATIPLSLAVGSAASLTFMTESRESLAGVAVAIALVPPSAVTGITIAMGNADILFDVLLVMGSNVSSLIFAGSITFKLAGVKPSTYYRQKVSEQQMQNALFISLTLLLLIGGMMTFLSYQDLQDSYVRSDVVDEIDTAFGDRVLRQDISVSPGQVTVELAVVDPQYTEADLSDQLEARTDRDVEVRMLAVAGQDGG